ncbi:hypothetical protein HYC85_028539 [Camellia sinensis]|uniref:Uncharacterized protein n=1 Tax=Camellia sinensis TaxID=4442 RepID=A0A7J7FXN1_CAMSI|nr:hypothetical protein HYC85_028539 [Camellia sinensis]
MNKISENRVPARAWTYLLERTPEACKSAGYGKFTLERLCKLKKLEELDLSHNHFEGILPPCLSNLRSLKNTFYKYNGVLERNFEIRDMDTMYNKADEVEFVTKSRTNFYRAGSILNFMSGLDLSCNKLTGEIPFELGKLSSVHALNLSRNLLTGPIPKAFSNLIQIESLDLSYNNLSGNIPTELIGLNFLEVFIVAHNNLSDGMTEDIRDGGADRMPPQLGHCKYCLSNLVTSVFSFPRQLLMAA